MKKQVRSALLLLALALVSTNVFAAHFTVTPRAPKQGSVAKVVVYASKEVTPPEIGYREKSFLSWRSGEGQWTAFVAVDRDAELGPTRMVVTASGEGRAPLASAMVTVADGGFKIQSLNVDKSKVVLSDEDQERVERERPIIYKAITTTSQERLWSGAFFIPVEGPISGVFGSQRIYNDIPGGYHSGLDVAVVTGTPIKTPARGVVVFAGDLFYTGNAVFVDHGKGLVTGYYHLHEIGVEVGDTLGVGQSLGTVGSTGRSTGPHLHWSAYLGGVKVDPKSLIKASSGL